MAEPEALLLIAVLKIVGMLMSRRVRSGAAP